jgi:Tfp pilus assembly protein PilF
MSTKSRKQQLEEMLAEDASDPFLLYGLAMEYVSERNDAEAVRRFEQIFVKAPDYIPAYLQAGQTLARLGRTAEARHVFERGVAVAGKAGDAHAAEEMQGMILNLPH